MKITADTNVLIRAVMQDDERQGRLAAEALEAAELIAVPLPCLCEFVWVLRRLYRLERDDIASAIRALSDTAKVVTDRQAIVLGLAVFERGGDFADGAIAHEGRWMGGEVFVSFDRQAVEQLQAEGRAARCLA